MIRNIGGRNPYEVRIREGSKQVRRRFRTKKTAEQFELAVRTREERRRNGLPEERGPISYDALCDLFLGQYNAPSKPWLKEMLKYSRDESGGVNVRLLLPDRFGHWLHALPLSGTTKGHIRDSAKQVLDSGVEWGYVAKNPLRARAVRPPQRDEPDVRPFASWEEVEAVAAAAGAYGPLIVFACATGLRPEEWIPLLWREVDLSGKRLVVNRVYVRGVLRADKGKTDAAFRSIVLQRRAIDALAALPRPLRENQLVFPAPQGGLINLDNFRRRVWKKAIEASELEKRPLYQCRHTFATLALAAGADIYWVSKQLGHRDIRTTLKRYARFVREVDDRNLHLLDEFAARGATGVSDTRRFNSDAD